MKPIVEHALSQALHQLQESGRLPRDLPMAAIRVERAREDGHGDYACNVALVLAKSCGKSPRELASMLVGELAAHPDVERVEVAGPGFINFFLRHDARTRVVATILSEAQAFGRSLLGQNQRVLVEYVSANPTGPLHVGHGRGAAFGATLANLLEVAGYKVSREYYVNDAGRQMNILAVSVWLRYLELAGEKTVFPANGYRGEYVLEIARDMLDEEGKVWVRAWTDIARDLPADEPDGGDREIYIDALVNRARELLGADGFARFHGHALESVLGDIREDLAEFGVIYDNWFSEQSLEEDGSIEKGIAQLRHGGHTYESEGALWFRATDFGDEKDRVLIRANGQSTYFASDVAYHWNKYNRGFDRVIDIFGADHHGYLTRVRAAVTALGKDPEALDVLLVQFAILYRNGERVQMSTRSGSFVTLRALRDEVGNDAARFFYVMRKPEQHLDFDLDLAKSQSNDNPVYYIQYAHARICSVLRQLAERGLVLDEASGLANLDKLTAPQETALLGLLTRYPEVIEEAARASEPHQLVYYLRELATGLHAWYNAVIFLCEEEALRDARLCLLKAVRQVLHNGLTITGVTSPESM